MVTVRATELPRPSSPPCGGPGCRRIPTGNFSVYCIIHGRRTCNQPQWEQKPDSQPYEPHKGLAGSSDSLQNLQGVSQKSHPSGTSHSPSKHATMEGDHPWRPVPDSDPEVANAKDIYCFSQGKDSPATRPLAEKKPQWNQNPDSKPYDDHKGRAGYSSSLHATLVRPQKSRLLPEFGVQARLTMRKSTSSTRSHQGSPTAARFYRPPSSPRTINTANQAPRPLQSPTEKGTSNYCKPTETQPAGSPHPTEPIFVLKNQFLGPYAFSPSANERNTRTSKDDKGPSEFSLHPRKSSGFAMSTEAQATMTSRVEETNEDCKQQSLKPSEDRSMETALVASQSIVAGKSKPAISNPFPNALPAQIVNSFHLVVRDWDKKREKAKEAAMGRVGVPAVQPSNSLPHQTATSASKGWCHGDGGSHSEVSRPHLKRKREFPSPVSSITIATCSSSSRPPSSRSSLISSDSSCEDKLHTQVNELPLELRQQRSKKEMRAEEGIQANKLGRSMKIDAICLDEWQLRDLEAMEDQRRQRSRQLEEARSGEESGPISADTFSYLRTHRVPGPKKKRRTCEERRKIQCKAFDSAKFDAMIYGQVGAAPPPPGIDIPVRKPGPTSAPGEDGRLYLNLDPRIHWPHNRSDEWYRCKMEEIKGRGGRKVSFGKVKERMREQRIKEEAEERAHNVAIRAGRLPPRKSPEPWMHNRHVDFGDVPEDELPDYVKENPAWLRSCAWLRSSREKMIRSER